MLRSLAVRGFALLEDVRADFAPGLNVLTGETGAGKSLLLGALAFLLGEKADATRLRAGAREAVVEGIFDVEGRDDSAEELLRLVEERTGVRPEDGVLALSRVLDATGRSRAFVNNRFLTRDALREVAGLLVALHGQREHSTLARPAVQREKLDAFAGLLGSSGPRAAFAAARAAALETLGRIRALRLAERDRLDRLDLLRFQSQEIRAAELRRGELAGLEDEFRELSNAERIGASLGLHVGALRDDEGSVVDRLASARRAFEALAALAPSIRPLAERLEEARLIVDDAAAEARALLERLEGHPGRLAEVTDRLDRIGRVLERFRVDETRAIELGASMEEEIERLEGAGSTCVELERSLDGACAELERIGRGLGAARRAASPRLAEEVRATLARLGMERARFEVALVERAAEPVAAGERADEEVFATPAILRRSAPTGLDDVELRIAPNVGEPMRPVGDIASGGELARVALAIESACAEVASLPTVLFDEVDENVGGRLAPALGEHLRRTAAGRQVFVVTHLAGVAVHADRHLHVAKEETGGRTRTAVRALEGEERVREIAVMMTGDATRPTALADARALLASVAAEAGVVVPRPRRAPATPRKPASRRAARR